MHCLGGREVYTVNHALSSAVWRCEKTALMKDHPVSPQGVLPPQLSLKCLVLNPGVYYNNQIAGQTSAAKPLFSVVFHDLSLKDSPQPQD